MNCNPMCQALIDKSDQSWLWWSMVQPPNSPFRDRTIWMPFLLVSFIWGTTWIVIKDQLGFEIPAWSVCFRFLTGGVAMLAWAMMMGLPLRMGARYWPLVCGLALAQFVLNFNFVYHAEAFITSGVCAVVYALLFIPNAVGSRLLFKERLSLRFWGGSLIAVAGIALLFLNELRANPVGGDAVLWGIMLAMLGVVSASCANVMQTTPMARSSYLPVLLGWSMLLGAGVNAVYAFAQSGAPHFVPQWQYWAGVVYLGVFASAVAFSQYYQLIRRIGAAKAAYTSVLIPVLAMTISTVVEGYHWSGLSVAGAVLAIIGLIVAMRR